MLKNPTYEELEREVKELKQREIEYKQAEESLRKSKANWRLLIENSPNTIMTVDINGTIQFINRVTEKFSGDAPVLGTSVYEYIPPEHTGMVRNAIEKVFDTGIPENFQTSTKNIEGSIVGWYGTHIGPLFDGKTIVSAILTFHDITNRKQAEKALHKSEEMYKALRESEERFRSLVESVNEWVWEVNDRGFYTYVSPQVYKLLGYKPEEIIGKNIFDFIAPEDIQRITLEFNSITKHSYPFENLEKRCLHKDGHVVTLEASGVPIINKIGTTTGFRGVNRDIAKRKQLEEELRQAHKMESIGTLTGGIAHDFNNILGIIIGNTELALDDIPEWDPAHFSLEEIKAASLRAAGIVKQLLSFSRKTDQELKPLEIIKLIEDTLKLLRSTIPTTIEIRKNIPATDITILADPIQINQIIMNLCINASQEMEKAGGVIEIIVENIIIDEDTANSKSDLSTGNYVKIKVSDTGPGIGAEIIDKIFDPYFTTKEVGKGSGMGLAVVHGIVKNHGGAITVDSEPGKGTTFNILFPVVAEKPEIETDINEDFPLGNETILFVDDENSILEMTKQMLKRLGYKVETEINPADALELFRSKPDQFDLVITDMTMPQMTGVKLSEKLIEIRPDIPVIICTGHSPLIDEEKAKTLGIAAYVMKPIVKQKIANTIRKVLDK